MGFYMIIQANPGFFRVFKEDHKTLFVDLSPIIAWQINKDGCVYSIATDGINEDSSNFFGYLCPNGSVSSIDCVYSSLEEAQKSIS